MVYCSLSIKQQFSLYLKPPLYEGHIWLPCSTRFLLGLSASSGLLMNLRRADLLGIVGELTASPYFLEKLHRKMLINSTGRRILFERPRMTLVTLNPKFLHTLPDYTLGNIYIKWMDTYGFVPGLRSCVRYINHEEWAYVMQRYRESHDFYHILMGLPATIEGEILLKWFEWINMGLPIAILSAIFGSFSLFLKKKCKNISYPLIKWAIQNGQQARESMINIYWEEELKTDINILRKRIGIIPYDLKESK